MGSSASSEAGFCSDWGSGSFWLCFNSSVSFLSPVSSLHRVFCLLPSRLLHAECLYRALLSTGRLLWPWDWASGFGSRNLRHGQTLGPVWRAIHSRQQHKRLAFLFKPEQRLPCPGLRPSPVPRQQAGPLDSGALHCDSERSGTRRPELGFACWVEGARLPRLCMRWRGSRR